MDADAWKREILAVAADKDGDTIRSLAEHLAACERAKTWLRARGYGTTGEAIDVMVRDVPMARGN